MHGVRRRSEECNRRVYIVRSTTRRRVLRWGSGEAESEDPEQGNQNSLPETSAKVTPPDFSPFWAGSARNNEHRTRKKRQERERGIENWREQTEDKQ